MGIDAGMVSAQMAAASEDILTILDGFWATAKQSGFARMLQDTQTSENAVKVTR